MFIHTKTQITIHADVEDSISHATIRPQDLIPIFLNVIKETPEYVGMVFTGDLAVITDAGASDNDERWESEDISYFLNETLWDVLVDYAPDGYYFGSHEGDASDYGYWFIEFEEGSFVPMDSGEIAVDYISNHPDEELIAFEKRQHLSTEQFVRQFYVAKVNEETLREDGIYGIWPWFIHPNTIITEIDGNDY